MARALLTKELRLVAAVALLPPLFWLALYMVAGLGGMEWGTDFHAFYGAAQKFRAHDPAVYDRHLLDAYLTEKGAASIGWPFPYPPSMGLLLWPLGFLSYSAAFWAWTLAGIVFFAWAQAVALSSMLSGWTKKQLYGFSLLLSVASPFALADIIAGQTGHICGGLLLLAVFQTSRPYLASRALGILLIKPQIAALAIVILLLRRQWKILGMGAAVAAILAGASAAIWGVGLWVDCFQYVQQFSQVLSARPTHQALTLSLPVTLRLVGVSQIAAMAAYVAVALGVLALLKREARLPVMLAGSVLLLPYGFWYDVAFLNVAVIWYLSQKRDRLRFEECLILCLILIGATMCVMGINAHYINLSFALVAALFGLLLRKEKI